MIIHYTVFIVKIPFITHDFIKLGEIVSSQLFESHPSRTLHKRDSYSTLCRNKFTILEET